KGESEVRSVKGWMMRAFGQSKRGLGAKPREPRDTANHDPCDKAGQALRAALFDPLRAALGEGKRLLLAPDGDLARLPFEVLPTDDGRRLIDAYQISYLGAGRDVLRWGAAVSGQPSAPVVAADPDFDLGARDARGQADAEEVRGRRTRDASWSALPFDQLEGTRKEGERIAALLGVKPWLRGQALEKRLKECRSPRILHLATHGFFLTDQPRDLNQEARGLGALGWQADKPFAAPGMENPLLRSGLALAGANWKNKGFTPPPEAEDGLLTAEDVTGLDLLATDLVVLSACETGLGEIHVGEGVFGLRRAFVLAGAKTLVMSLWKVSDEATRELMEDFYARILQGEGRAEALRQAQLTMKEKYPDPYYWGAFICQGEPGPLHL
ncbi:MAG TPA: CHAT domain-containing protein, partial [Blastocatellia bacterium]|nr:CHAT domain-containing protein [Blastocatellia bacterium]